MRDFFCFCWKVLWLAFSHSLGIAQTILFFALIGFGLGASFLPFPCQAATLPPTKS